MTFEAARWAMVLPGTASGVKSGGLWGQDCRKRVLGPVCRVMRRGLGCQVRMPPGPVIRSGMRYRAVGTCRRSGMVGWVINEGVTGPVGSACGVLRGERMPLGPVRWVMRGGLGCRAVVTGGSPVQQGTVRRGRVRWGRARGA